MTSLATIDFHQTAMSVLTNDQGDWIFPGQICKNMGVDAEAQRKLIERSHWSDGMTSVMEVMLPGQVRAYPNFALHSRRFAMWMATITTSRIKDENAQALVEQYQTEAADVLADWLAKRDAPVPAKPMLPQDYLEALKALVASEETKQQLEAERHRLEVLAATERARNRALEAIRRELTTEVEQAKPKVRAHDQLMESEGTYSFAQAAKMLPIPLGRNRLFELLREAGMLIGRSREPYQEYIDRGYFKIIAQSYPSSGDIPVSTYTPRITPKGLEYIRRTVIGA